MPSDTGEKRAGLKNDTGLKEELSKKAGAIKGKETQPQEAGAVKETGEPMKKAGARKAGGGEPKGTETPGVKDGEPKKAGTVEEKAGKPKKTGTAKEKEGEPKKIKPTKEKEESRDGNETQPSPAGPEKPEKAAAPSPFIRLLRADEIECRVSTISQKGLSLLLFKDARVDQRILDEAFTPFGWKRTHQSIDGNLYCTVEIWDGEKGQWIAKQDVGTESRSEKEKGQASDSFKRACFNWGLGRELYTAPFIWVPAEAANISQEGGRYVTSDCFYVQHIAYNENREIAGLRIVNGRGFLVYELKRRPEIKFITGIQMEALEQELARTGVSMEAVLERYGLREPGQITAEIFAKAISSLKKTKTKEAA
ncbi:hypothetical protein [Petralouisia muris]|uniref:hypothetical protein n=1 Tax=Petralouisia muris TaxID=3032872 RepID=UPI0023B83477|nr:hypothetical protein [Petralouisia muris]